MRDEDAPDGERTRRVRQLGIGLTTLERKLASFASSGGGTD